MWLGLVDGWGWRRPTSRDRGSPCGSGSSTRGEGGNRRVEVEELGTMNKDRSLCWIRSRKQLFFSKSRLSYS